MTPTVTNRWEVSPPLGTLVRVSAGEVHIWRFSLDAPTELLDSFSSALDDKERARADRYRLDSLRRRFLAGRIGLRLILSRYLDVSPSAVAFCYGEHGKPGLAQAAALEFNLTHSQGVALCAVTSGHLIGVDIEERRPMENASGIIGRFFSETEQAEYLSTPEVDRQGAFYRGWTRKEAYLKAVGTGLATALDSFDVSLGKDEPARLRRVGKDPDEAGRWSLFDLDVGEGFAAAVAVRQEEFPRRIRLFRGVPTIRSEALRWD